MPTSPATRWGGLPLTLTLTLTLTLSLTLTPTLPAVVSPLASDGIGVTGGVSEEIMWGDFDKPLCVGATTAQLATCAVRLHSDKQLWTPVLTRTSRGLRTVYAQATRTSLLRSVRT